MVLTAMSESDLKLKNAPIVEALVEIDCDLPAGTLLAELEEPARQAFDGSYPQMRIQQKIQGEIRDRPDEVPAFSASPWELSAFQFFQVDPVQVVQVREQGFSFNRLRPYTTLDDYMPEIRRCWDLYRQIATPQLVRAIRLRYINRILLPVQGAVNFDQYFRIGPKIPDEEGMDLTGFLNQYSAIERDSGHHILAILTAQPVEEPCWPVILDITVGTTESHDADDLPWIEDRIRSLRRLKNDVFRRTLTESCLSLFQHSKQDLA